MNLQENIEIGWRWIRQILNLTDYLDIEAAEESIRKNVIFRGPNTIILFCAIIIASVGLNVNSIPVIIGAMLISPLMSPILGFGLGLGIHDTDLLHQSLRNFGIMVGISLLSSTLFFLVSPLDLEHPTELLARTNPTIYDVLIALFGGFAGILEVSRKKNGTVMSGVAIATALMPPLCTVGYGLASWQWNYVIGAFYLFFINSIFISLAAYIGTKALGYPVKNASNPKHQLKLQRRFTFVLFILLIPSIISGYRVIRENSLSREITALVSENKHIGNSFIYDYNLDLNSKPQMVQLFIAGEGLSKQDSVQLFQSIEKHGLSKEQVEIKQNAAYSDKLQNNWGLIQDILNSTEQNIHNLQEENKLLRQEIELLKGDSTLQED